MASPPPQLAAAAPAPAPLPPGRKLTTIDLVGGIFCHICELVLSNKKEFDSHYLQHSTGTEVITYTCVACYLSSTSYPSFRGHCYTTHVIKDRFRCDKCNKTFSKLSALKEHIEVIHNFKCNKPDCNKKFSSKKELHFHQMLHKNDANKPPYPCQTCRQEMENLQSCEDHIDQHCLFTYPCPLCNENLTKENASIHLAIHFGHVLTDDIDDLDVETPDDSSINIVGGILCCHCEKIYKNRFEIDTHFEEEHPNELVVYTCVICQKSISKYTLYGNHCYEHFSKNKFVCDVCDKSFSRRSTLVVHSELHAGGGGGAGGGGRGGSCRLCGLHLSDAAAAQRHLSTHRRAQYSCPVCSRKYAEKYLLMKHAPQHFEAVFHLCKVCGKVFAAKNRLIEHVKTHSTLKTYACPYCSKTFLKPYQLRQHVNVHTGARPYSCAACPKTFASLPNVHKHMRRMHDIDPKKRKPYNTDPKSDNNKKENEPEIDREVCDDKKWFDVCDILETESIDSSEVEREARRYEAGGGGGGAGGGVGGGAGGGESFAELTPILPEDIDKFVTEMLSETGSNIPREYGPDFGPDEAPLVHVAPHMVAAPPAPLRPWEPVITKVCGYYNELDDAFPFIDTDVF